MRITYIILIEMPNNKNRKKKSPEARLAEKYAMTPEDIKGHEKKVQATKTKFSMDAAEVEKALTEYLELTDPIVFEGKAIMWCKRPSMKQLKAMIPKEMRPYIANPEKVPDKLNKKYEDFFYEKMAELIAVPTKSVAEWQNIANPWLVRLFWNHIADIAELLEGRVEGF